MARQGQHDQSPGDGREPFSDEGGPEGRHASTHDVRREEVTRPKGGDTGPDEFDLDLEKAPAAQPGHVDGTVPASTDKELRTELSLDADELGRLSILAVGTRLEQGGTYVDLNDLAAGPFKALGSQEAGEDNRYVAKRDVDYELWDELVGQGRQATVERPV